MSEGPAEIRNGASRSAVIWFNAPPTAASLDCVDVLTQVGTVRDALGRMGYRTHEIPFSLSESPIERCVVGGTKLPVVLSVPFGL